MTVAILPTTIWEQVLSHGFLFLTGATSAPAGFPALQYGPAMDMIGSDNGSAPWMETLATMSVLPAMNNRVRPRRHQPWNVVVSKRCARS
jgi:hypothetical protein